MTKKVLRLAIETAIAASEELARQSRDAKDEQGRSAMNRLTFRLTYIRQDLAKIESEKAPTPEEME